MTARSSSSRRRTSTSSTRHHALGAAAVAGAVAGSAAALLALLFLPSTTLAFIVPSPGAQPPAAAHACVASRRPAWVVEAPPRARRLFTPAPAAAAASAVDNEEDDEDDEDRGPRPPRPSTPAPIPISYESELLPSPIIDAAWNAQRKPLLRLGTKGVQKSHRNSLKELLVAHQAIRVKVNGPTQDVKHIADRLAAPAQGEEEPLALVLRVKGKEFLLATPAEVAALQKGKKPGAAESESE